MNVPPGRSWQRLVIGVEASDVDAVVDRIRDHGMQAGLSSGLVELRK